MYVVLVPSVVFCVTLPLLSYVKVDVLRPFDNCVKAWGFAYHVSHILALGIPPDRRCPPYAPSLAPASVAVRRSLKGGRRGGLRSHRKGHDQIKPPTDRAARGAGSPVRTSHLSSSEAGKALMFPTSRVISEILNNMWAT